MADDFLKIIYEGCKQLLNNIPIYKEERKKHIVNIYKDEMKKEDIEFGQLQKQRLEQAFKDAVDEFYTNKEEGLYKRTHSLYNLLDFDDAFDSDGLIKGTNEDGFITSNKSFEALVNKNKIVSTRRNRAGAKNYMYNLIFVEGWHGGADKIDPDKAETWGYHPSPGVPHYRRPGVVVYPNGVAKHHPFARWGNAAVRDENSPLETFIMLSQAWQENELEEDADKLHKKHMEEVINRKKAIEAILAYKYLWPPWIDKK